MAADASVSLAARLVGREHDLARLRGLVANPPPGALIMVTGEAGIGKTSLVNHVVAERLAAGDRALRGAGDERATARFSMWRRVMRELGVALPHADPSVGAADQVEELAATIGDSLATGLWRTIVLEDVHWADTSSVEVLQLVVDRLIACPVAIVATARTGEPRAQALSRLQRQSQSIVLTGLTPADIEAIAIDHTGETLAPAAAATLQRRTGGNPLFVRELLAAGTTRLSIATGGLLTDALTGLGPVTADVLGTIAIAGRAAPLAATAHALSMAADDLELHQRRALDAAILTSGADGVWFRHDLLADAAVTASILAPVVQCTARSPTSGRPSRTSTTTGSSAPGTYSRPHRRTLPSRTQTSSWRPPLPYAGSDEPATPPICSSEPLDAWGTAPTQLSTRLWMALGEARWDLAERPAALECFDRAAEAARRDRRRHPDGHRSRPPAQPQSVRS